MPHYECLSQFMLAALSSLGAVQPTRPQRFKADLDCLLIMACSVLTGLPDSLISVILTSWLTSTDLGRLDSACCSTFDRRTLLSTLTIDTVVVNFNDEDRPPPPSEDIWYTYVNFLRWTALRGARIADLTMCAAVFADSQLRSGLLCTSGATIQNIVFASGVVDPTLPSEVINNYCNTIAEVSNACRRTTTLKVRGEWGSDRFLFSIFQAFPRVQRLKLDSMVFTADGLQNSRNLTAIERLTISGSFAPLPPDLAVPTLEFFNAYGVNVTDDLVVALGRNCPQLHTLLCGKHRNGVTDAGARALLHGCPLLQRCSVEHMGGVSDMLRVELARRCEWRKLRVAEWVGFSDALGRSLVTLKPELVLLDASSSSRVTDEMLAVAARHCRLLEGLYLDFADHITVAGIRPFIRVGNKLMALSSCGNADDTLMQLVAEHCKELRMLHVFEYGDSALRVTDAGVRAVLEGCPLLQQTDVEYADDISIELRVELAKRGAYVTLQLSKWIGLSEELLIGIFTVCPQLQCLKCHRIGALTDAALAACAQHCPLLSSLSIDKCHAVTSRGLVAFFHSGSKLLFVGLHRMECVDDTVAEAIIQHCAGIRSLSLPTHLSEETKVRLRGSRCFVRFSDRLFKVETFEDIVG
jgi:hypothetical protein